MTGHWWREILEVVKEDGVFCTNAGFLKEQGSLPLAGWMEWGKGCWIVRKQWLFFFWPHHMTCSQFSKQGLNLCPHQWKHRVLITGQPGNSQWWFSFTWMLSHWPPAPPAPPAPHTRRWYWGWRQERDGASEREREYWRAVLNFWHSKDKT